MIVSSVMDREKRREKILAISFAIVVCILVVLLVILAFQPMPDNEFEPNPAGFRVGETDIMYNNTTGWWVHIPITYDHDCYVDLESHGCTVVKFVFDIELDGGARDNWTTEAIPLPEVPEGYENDMTVKLQYVDREPISVSLKEILCV